MPPPGWYPDPDGTPGRLRYWDGRVWTGQTGSAVAPPVGSGRRSGRRWWLAAVVVLAVAALVVAAVWWRPRVDGTSSPTSSVSGGDDRAPTASPSRTPPAAQRPCPVDIAPSLSPPAADGRVHGGLLTFKALSAPWTPPGPTNRFPYSRDSHVQTLRLPEQRPWQASAEVGVLEMDGDPSGSRTTARLLECVEDSGFYTSVDVRVTRRTTQEVTVGRSRATRLDARLEFRHPELITTGSDIRIIVVQTQPRTYYFHAVPKERTDLIAELDAATASLRVD